MNIYRDLDDIPEAENCPNCGEKIIRESPNSRKPQLRVAIAGEEFCFDCWSILRQLRTPKRE
jgi:hypothetical protein